jgi:hypothetical protein
MTKNFVDEMKKLAKERKDIYRDLAAGAASGVLSSNAVYAIDTISNRKQIHPGETVPHIIKNYYNEGKRLAQEGKLYAKVKSIGTDTKPIYEAIPHSRPISTWFSKHPRLGGFSHFYGGAGVKIFKVAPLVALQFALYEALKSKPKNETKTTTP